VTVTYSASYTIGEVTAITVDEMVATANGGSCGDYDDLAIVLTSGAFDLVADFDIFSWPA